MLRFLWKDLLHYGSQTFFNILGLAVVVFSYLILMSLAETMDELVSTSSLSRNLIVIQAEAAVIDESNISDQVISAARELTPGTLSRVSPIIFRNIRISNGITQLRSSPVEDWETVFHLQLVEGKWPSAPDEIAIGSGAKIANHWQVGTSLHIYGRDFRVSAVFQSPGMNFASIWMPLEKAQDLFAPRRSSQMLALQVAPGSDAESVRLKLEQDPRLAGQYAILYEDNIARRNTQILHDFAMLVRVVALIALASIIFGAYNLTSLSLEERRREVGTLRALGFSSRTVVLFLALRALLLGLLACLPALAAAWMYMTVEKNLAPIYIIGLPFLFELSMSNVLACLAWMLTLPPLGAWLAAQPLLQSNVVFTLQRN